MATATKTNVYEDAPREVPFVLNDQLPGLFVPDVADLPEADRKQRLTFAEFALSIGQCIGQKLLTIDPVEGATEPILGVTPNDRARASTRSLENGVYIYRSDVRHSDASELIENRNVAGIKAFQKLGLHLPFEATSYSEQPDVVFSEEDHFKMPRSPDALARAIRNLNLFYTKGNPNTKERTRRSKSAPAQAMAGYVVNVMEMLTVAQSKRKFYDHLHIWVDEPGAGRIINRNNLPAAQKMIGTLAMFNHLLSDFVEVSALNNDWNRSEINGVHLAHAKRLFMNPNALDAEDGFRNRLKLLEGYNNALTFKMVQALVHCRQYKSLYHEHIRAVIEERQKQASEGQINGGQQTAIPQAT